MNKQMCVIAYDECMRLLDIEKRMNALKNYVDYIDEKRKSSGYKMMDFEYIKSIANGSADPQEGDPMPGEEEPDTEEEKE